MTTKKAFLLALPVLLISSIVLSAMVSKLVHKKKSMQVGDQPAMLVFPAGSTYEKEWKKTDSLMDKGLNKSALELVEAIYKRAKSEKNAPQLVKSIMHRLRLQQQMQEESTFNAIGSLRDELKSSSYPLTPILHSVLAEIYQGYYNQNRWKFQQRTQVVNLKMDDISTWDLKTLFDQIIKNHLLALTSADSLKRTPLNMYDQVLNYSTDDGRKLRPTLYDFIAHRAIDFLMNDEPDVIRPAYKFELSDENYFGQANEFAQLNISTKDSLSTKYYAARILQDLIAFHLKDKDPSALLDVDLKRLHFVRNHATTGINDSLYLEALLSLEKNYLSFPASTEVSFSIASFYNGQAGKYDPRKSEQYKGFNKKAVEVCSTAAARFSESFGAQHCVSLESVIKAKNMSFTLEKVNLPDRPFRGYLSYKNMTKLYARAIPVDFDKHARRYNNYQGYNSEEMMKQYIKNKPAKEWNFEVPDDQDFQTHYLEFKVPELPFGYYMIVLSDKADFDVTDNGIAYGFSWVSNLSFVNRKLPDGDCEFHVLNRETGMPVKSVLADLWANRYNEKLRKYEYVKSGSYTSDEQGYFIAKADKPYGNYELELTSGKDQYRTESELYIYPETPSEAIMYPMTKLFTDRAIYRPGQIVYFKGIMINTDGKRNEILANHPANVNFYDVNSQVIASLNLVTNEYGSYSGTFTAPNGVLNGQMSINDGYGSVNFSVEDYKRPKFEVTFSPLKGSYRLEDSVKVQGTAKAYSGSCIDGAQVKYRVVREASFPWWWWCWWGYYPNSPQTEICNGTALTNDTGGYVIRFKAIPDRSVNKSSSPVYHYTVYADVTDINGETHSSQTVVSLSYNAINLSVEVPAEVTKRKDATFAIHTTNTNGVYEPAKGKLEIYRLQQPEKTYRSREWERPDRFIMSREEYSKAFPLDIYADENNQFKWERGEKMLETPFDTDSNRVDRKQAPPGNLVIKNLSSWKPGVYVLEAHARDKFGEDVKDIKYFTVYSEKESTVPLNTPDWFTVVKNQGEPGEKAAFLVGSADTDVNILFETEEQNKITGKQLIKISKEQKLIEIPIGEKNRGNFGVHFTFVKNGRAYQHSKVITVPWTNKELDLQFETFRDKLLPGQKEEWKIRIKNKSGDKQLAELMATLYDASLDAFRVNNWDFSIYNTSNLSLPWSTNLTFETGNSQLYFQGWNSYSGAPSRTYPSLNWFGLYQYYGYYYNYGDDYAADEATIASVPMGGASPKSRSGYKKAFSEALRKSDNLEEKPNFDKSAAPVARPPAEPRPENPEKSEISVRTNFNETAFFFPQLQTDEQGSVIINFTVPEALTRWKMMGLAHTKDLKAGQISKELVTQKQLMVVPNAPRFFRENDKIEFTSKISNLSSGNLSGTAQLVLYDALTMKDVTSLILNQTGTADLSVQADQNFSVKKGLSTLVKWNLVVPEGLGAITYKVMARAGNFSDGEEMAVPVLTNRMLVTESMPLPIRSKQTKTFRFEKLISQNGGSKTLRNHKLTLEFTANPAWYAVQSLPYLMEYPYECAEQTFARFYANSIASHIANSSPKIKAVFDSWKSQSPDALLSNLEKNQELKALMLEETPWVLEAKDESERKKRVALLFDLNRMSNELSRALSKLEKMQLSNGGWPWFENMPDDRYITQYIITGMGHLDHLGVTSIREEGKTWSMVKRGVLYLDDRMREDYDRIIKHDAHPELDHLDYEDIQYLYARSYFTRGSAEANVIAISSRDQKAFDYFKGQAKKYWLDKGRYMQGMIALALNRYDEKSTAGDIMKSLKENSISNEEMGMYWKENYEGFYWWEAPVESQALMIEAFDEVSADKKAVDDLKVWLLKSKQTQNWQSTKATSEACYALLLRGTDWLTTESQVEITLGNVIVDPKKLPDGTQEAGTGYFKTSWNGSAIKPEMGNVTVSKKDEGVSWGALYWQYFEQLDKITPAKTPLQLIRKLFVERNTPSGPVLDPIDEHSPLKIGDRVKVRIELRVDRDMQYVHLKDMRASGLEPINVISRYKWQDGLGYYESTRDAATNFFIGWLPKGTYVFEYPLRVTHNGDFSNGIASIQCMYAPEFSSHSEGIRLSVGK